MPTVGFNYMYYAVVETEIQGTFLRKISSSFSVMLCSDLLASKVIYIIYTLLMLIKANLLTNKTMHNM